MSTTKDFQNVSVRRKAVLAEVVTQRRYKGQDVVVSARVMRRGHLSVRNQIMVVGKDSAGKLLFSSQLSDTGVWMILPMISYKPQAPQLTVQLVAEGGGIATGELTVIWQEKGSAGTGGTAGTGSGSGTGSGTGTGMGPGTVAGAGRPGQTELKPLSAEGGEWCAVASGQSNIVPIYRRGNNTLPPGGVTPVTNREARIIRSTN